MQLSADEKKMVNQANELMNKSSNLRFNFNTAENGFFVQGRENLIQMHQQTISQSQNTLTQLRNEPEAFKKVFSLTKAALKDKNRKQILENIHNVYKLTSLTGLSQKQRGALYFISQTSENHLRYFQNPFSWHEYTGQRPESPPYPMKLSEFTAPSSGIGFGGGYIGGAGSGLGSGVGGGLNGGAYQGGQGVGF